MKTEYQETAFREKVSRSKMTPAELTDRIDRWATHLDRQRRFDTEVAPGTDEDGAAIRIAQPKLGVHYYVMRLSAS